MKKSKNIPAYEFIRLCKRYPKYKFLGNCTMNLWLLKGKADKDWWIINDKKQQKSLFNGKDYFVFYGNNFINNIIKKEKISKVQFE